jgi:serine/threonine protein kinase
VDLWSLGVILYTLYQTFSSLFLLYRSDSKPKLMDDVLFCFVLFFLITRLCGYPPFYHDDEEELLNLVAQGKFDFPDESWAHISNNGW